MVCVGVVVSSVVWAADERPEIWIAEHTVPRTQETIVRNANGGIESITVTRELVLTVKQRYVETRRTNEDGVLRLAEQSQTTEVVDTLGGKAVVTERNKEDRPGLRVTDVVDIRKAASGVSVTSVFKRDGDGELELVSQTTREVGDDDSVITTVEKQDPASLNGRLRIESVTSEK